VPDDLVGKDWALAAVALQNAGLDPRKQSVDSEKNPDEVLAVDKAGDVVKRGTTIVVKVAKTPTSTATVTVTPPPPATTTNPPTTPPPTTLTLP
jgi:serine/threonine-protein kinase